MESDSKKVEGADRPATTENAPQTEPENAPVKPKKNAPKTESKPHLVVDNDRTSKRTSNAPKSSGERSTAGAGAGAGVKAGAKRSAEHFGLRVRAGTNLNKKYKRNFEDIYRAVKYFIQRGAVDPKHAHIKALGVGTDTATRVLAGLRGEGVITRKGNSHELVALKYINDVDSKKVIPELEKLIKAA